MGFCVESWLTDLTGRIRDTFGPRLRYVGHTGSYARGEAKETSDIDVNVVLDELRFDDLAQYRNIIHGMPNSGKACGFICGEAELRAWPRMELFQFMMGSRTLMGTLEGIVAPPEDRDIKEHIRVAASSIYHQVCHQYIHGTDLVEKAGQLAFAYKTAFFVLQEQVYLREGCYVPTHKALMEYLCEQEKEVMETGMHWDRLAADRKANPQRYFEMLRVWSGAALRSSGADMGEAETQAGKR